jgi:hypothetical protein
LERVADLNNGDSKHTLIHAIYCSQFSVSQIYIDLLLEHGADVKWPWYGEMEDTLGPDVQVENIHNVRWFSERGADINGECRSGPPLFTAFNRGYSKIVLMLIKNKHSAVTWGLRLRHVALQGPYYRAQAL